MNDDRRTEIEFESARLEHATSIKQMETETNMIAGFANAAMRAPALAAAGGIAAMLGFYSANASVLRGTPAVASFNCALIWFFAAILACVIAPGAAYFSQGFFASSRGAQTHHFDRPFVRDTWKSKALRWAGTFFQICAICLTLCSMIALIAGGIAFIDVADFAARR